MSSPFLRKELKYIITQNQKEELLKALNDVITYDEFCSDGKEYHINNVYFDTLNNDVVRTSIAKPMYKAKLRLRYYDSTSTYFLELKKKFQGVVFKKRIEVTKDEYDNFKDNMILPTREDYKSVSVLNDIKVFLDTFPKESGNIYLGYDRLAYISTLESSPYRLTFDSHVAAYNIREQKWCDILRDDEVLMEIKVEGSLPLFLAKILNSLEVYPTPFSKYGKYYSIETRKKEKFYV